MTSKPKILIVDDEFLIGMALADALRQHGFEIVGPFATADNAMRAIEATPPDAAFLDVNLGRGRTSYELAATLVDAGLPVTFLTGYNEFEPNDQRLNGANVLGKPVDNESALLEARRMVSGK